MNHKNITNNLEERLKNSGKYELILKNIEYNIDNKHGEYDLLALRSPYALVFEIKGSDTKKARNKAYKQLAKDFRYIQKTYNPERIFLFYAFSKNNTIYIELYKGIN